MSSGIDCGKLEEVLESIFQIPVDAARLDKWVNGGEFETVVLGGREVPTLRNLIRQIDERESQAAEEEINEAKAEIGALAEKIQAKIDELKAMTASAETLPSDHPATVYYNAGTGEFAVAHCAEVPMRATCRTIVLSPGSFNAGLPP